MDRNGFVIFGTQAEAETYLRAIDGYSGRTMKLENGKWGVSFRRVAEPELLAEVK